jgi:hypothetical protein
MPAKDLFHKAVKHALEKENWLITDDPLHLKMGTFDYYIDLGAEEEIIAAEKEQRQIAIEIKSFVAPSTVNEFHTVLGQFLNYKLALEIKQPQRVLYLAVPKDVYQSFFQINFTQLAVQRYQLKLIIYDTQNEEILEWIES